MKHPSKILAALAILPLAAGLSGCASATDSTEATCAKVKNWAASANSTTKSVSAYDLKAQLKYTSTEVKGIAADSKDDSLKSALEKMGAVYRQASDSVSKDANLKDAKPFENVDKNQFSQALKDVEAKCGTL